MSKSVDLTVNGPVAVLRLCKPPVNALDEPSLRELGKAVQEAEEDPAVRAVIVASALEGTFCAGGDLKYWPHVYRNRADQITEAGRCAFVPIEQLSKPSIAAIQGHVIGDGLSLALACDIRLAAQRVTFHLPEGGCKLLELFAFHRCQLDAHAYSSSRFRGSYYDSRRVTNNFFSQSDWAETLY